MRLPYGIMSSPRLIVALVSILACPSVGRAQTCDNIATSGTQSMQGTVQKTNTSPTPNCSVTDGMYVSYADNLRIDVLSTATGHCTVKGWHFWPMTCEVNDEQDRTIGHAEIPYTFRSDGLGTGSDYSWGHVYFSPTFPYYQTLDSTQ
jgi:hypothetical protein